MRGRGNEDESEAREGGAGSGKTRRGTSVRKARMRQPVSK